MTDYNDNVPPAGEDIHLPGPSILPLAMAIGITLTIIGLTISFWFIIVGIIMFLVTLVMWVRDTRRDIDELPEEHHHAH